MRLDQKVSREEFIEFLTAIRNARKQVEAFGEKYGDDFTLRLFNTVASEQEQKTPVMSKFAQSLYSFSVSFHKTAGYDKGVLTTLLNYLEAFNVVLFNQPQTQTTKEVPNGTKES